jgi:hypothetical protein
MKEVRFAYCGKKQQMRKMIRRRLNGKDVFCCSLGCETKWEKINLIGVCG